MGAGGAGGGWGPHWVMALGRGGGWGDRGGGGVVGAGSGDSGPLGGRLSVNAPGEPQVLGNGRSPAITCNLTPLKNELKHENLSSAFK